MLRTIGRGRLKKAACLCAMRCGDHAKHQQQHKDFSYAMHRPIVGAVCDRAQSRYWVNRQREFPAAATRILPTASVPATTRPP